MSQFLHFDVIPRRFMYTLKFEKHWSRISFLTVWWLAGWLVWGPQLGTLILWSMWLAQPSSHGDLKVPGSSKRAIPTAEAFFSSLSLFFKPRLSSLCHVCYCSIGQCNSQSHPRVSVGKHCQSARREEEKNLWILLKPTTLHERSLDFWKETPATFCILPSHIPPLRWAQSHLLA